MAIDYPALATEIQTDPKTLGYAGKEDGEISVLLNTVGLSGETITKQYIALDEAVAAVVRTEYTALTNADKDAWRDLVTAAQRIKTGSANMRTTMASIFASGTTSRANLVALATRSASRGEVLFGEGTTVTADDVARALGRG